MNPSTMQIIATTLFGLAVIHTFSSSFFAHLGHRFPTHMGLWHLLGEVEVVFGLWAGIMVVVMFFHLGQNDALKYIEGRNFTEPLFVFSIMVVAASRPITTSARDVVRWLAHKLSQHLPIDKSLLLYFLTLSVIPLFGSFITEPAAMTLAALMLRDTVLSQAMPQRVKYLTVGALFVNVSIGGVLTPYAAPPILMVAGPWNWDLGFMLSMFGWRSVIAVIINAAMVSYICRKDIIWHATHITSNEIPIPLIIKIIYFHLLAGIVFFAHHPVIFIPLLLFSLGLATAYPQFQNATLMLRESMMVAFFLGGLVVLGGMQVWWLQDLLGGLTPHTLFWSAAALTAITDNAALTYLGSLVEGTDAAFRYALVSGAIAGGGLTVIANAPNPAGIAILKNCFEDDSVNPLKLFAAAIVPTSIAMAMFLLPFGQ
ncbi:MAG: putative Na+/H+ antiporter [Burkholderiales bacterium]|jgi:hypothetical protein|nr:putative Na+/H+ antiporter [Burkholderiales bacterium]